MHLHFVYTEYNLKLKTTILQEMVCMSSA